MKTPKICITCGTQYPVNDDQELCIICSEERQYIPEEGQQWITPEALASNHKNEIIQLNDRLFEIVTRPQFAIGQRALLVLSENGNILWDCISLLANDTLSFISKKGGLKAIAISHPHYYASMNEWATTFNCPVYLHQHDEQWIVDEGEKIVLWQGDEKLLWDDIRIINIGGHFAGSCVLLIPSMSEKGTILCGDTMYLSPSKKHFAVMYSYPNRMPLPISEIKRIKERFEALQFDSIYGFYSYQNLTENVKDIVRTSFERYY